MSRIGDVTGGFVPGPDVRYATTTDGSQVPVTAVPPRPAAPEPPACDDCGYRHNARGWCKVRDAEPDTAPDEDYPCPVAGGDSPCVLPAGHYGRCLR